MSAPINPGYGVHSHAVPYGTESPSAVTTWIDSSATRSSGETSAVEVVVDADAGTVVPTPLAELDEQAAQHDARKTAASKAKYLELTKPSCRDLTGQDVQGNRRQSAPWEGERPAPFADATRR